MKSFSYYRLHSGLLAHHSTHVNMAVVCTVTPIWTLIRLILRKLAGFFKPLERFANIGTYKTVLLGISVKSVPTKSSVWFEWFYYRTVISYGNDVFLGNVQWMKCPTWRVHSGESLNCVLGYWAVLSRTWLQTFQRNQLSPSLEYKLLWYRSLIEKVCSSAPTFWLMEINNKHTPVLLPSADCRCR
jgi:hypothetical protein